MKVDHLNYQRAASRCLLGLGLQLALAVITLIYSVTQRDHAGFTAALLLLVGSVVWLVLAIVFDQHRRERLEALEAETLAAQSARATTVFEESADDLRVAAKRLRGLHKYFVPAASLVVAAGFIGIGMWRLEGGRELIDPDKFRVYGRPGWAISIAVLLAVAGFLFARYIAGMAKQKLWANLRAGGAQSMGAAVLGVAMIVGHIFAFAGNMVVLRYLPSAFAVLGLVLGAEILLNFVLNLYRPRARDQMPRPAMESSLLGFLAAPDKIADTLGGAVNYQFGFDVTGSWFYQLLSRSFLWLGLMLGVVVWLMTSLFVVNPDERGLVTTRGRFVAEVGPGWGFKWPWPISRVERFSTTTSRRLELATPSAKTGKAILWTNAHGVEEVNLLVRPGAVDEAAGASGAAEDLSIISAVVPVFYAVEDLSKFNAFATPEARERLLVSIGRRELTMFLATVSVDDILGAGRQRVSEELRQRLNARYQEVGAGIRVLFTGVEGVHPPLDVAGNFEEVVRKQQDAIGAVELAEDVVTGTLSEMAGTREAAREIIAGLEELDRLERANDPKAAEQSEAVKAAIVRSDGRASVLIRQAQAKRWAIHMGARGAAERLDSLNRAYEAAPDYFMANMYFQTLAEAMKQARVYIVVDDAPVEFRTDLTESAASGAYLPAPEPDE
jgi:regulator of protease activity HflC (stomatin/prohibitin superfamily)